MALGLPDIGLDKKEIAMKKLFGDITVQKSGKHGCGIVEMLAQHCVIGYWEKRDVGGDYVPEFKVVHDRLVSIDYDRESFFEALAWGQKLAEVLV